MNDDNKILQHYSWEMHPNDDDTWKCVTSNIGKTKRQVL